MRILFVTHFLPFPPDDGGKIGYFNPIKYLGRNHEVHVASLGGPEEIEHAAGLRRFCASVEVHPYDGWAKRTNLIWNHARGIPGTAASYFDPRFGEKLRQIVSSRAIDIVQLEHLNTAGYLKFVNICPVVFREHNAEYRVWERHGNAGASLENLAVRALAPWVKRYEAKMLNQFSHCLTVSEADRVALAAIAPAANIRCIPSGVDSEYFVPMAITEEPDSMVITGSFGWKPKQHNLRILLAEIFPQIRRIHGASKLYVVGKGIPSDLVALAREIPGVQIVGAVPDVRPFIGRATLILNYLESGGGIALKVLEALAMKKAVLSNALGCEGIEAVPGRHLSIANTKEEYVAEAVKLLREPHRRLEMAEAGYRHVLQAYSWRHLALTLQECYESVLTQPGGLAAQR